MKFKTNTSRKKIYLAVFVIAVVLGLGAGNVNKAYAGYCVYTRTSNYSYTSLGWHGLTSSVISTTPNTQNQSGATTAKNDADCQSQCSSGNMGGVSGTDSNCKYYDNANDAQNDINNRNASFKNTNQQNQAQVNQAIQKDTGGDDICPKTSIFHPQTWFNCILLIVMRFMGILITLAASLLNAVLDPDLFNSIMQNPALYTAWADVRDVLDVAFIMMLLFSAFCTVFQIDKYNYKKILLNLVIMALLVNFSWPIARFIIDFGNVLMYYFVNTFGLAQGGLWTSFAGNSGLYSVIHPASGASSDTSLLLASVVFLFIFAVTLLVIAILLVIRVIVLAILVIFSSVAFVGSIIPGVSSYSGKWWDSMFKYVFFGPIMTFMIALSLAMMVTMQSVQSTFNITSNAQAGLLGPTIAAFAFFSIPVIILWVGLGFAQQLSIYGAGAAKKYSMGAMKWATYGGAAWGLKKSGISGGVKKRWDNSYFGTTATKKRQEKRESFVYGKLRGKTDAEQEMKKKAEEYKKENESTESLKKKADSGDAAAAYRLALDGDIDANTYKNAMSKIKDKRVKDLIEGKTRDKRIDVVIDYKIETERTTESLANKIAAERGVPVDDTLKAEAKQLIADQEIGKIAPSKWKDQNIEKLTGYNPENNSYDMSEESVIKRTAAKKAIDKYTPKNKEKITDDMTGSKYAAGESAGIW